MILRAGHWRKIARILVAGFLSLAASPTSFGRFVDRDAIS
jgi:hypothetical protein